MHRKAQTALLPYVQSEKSCSKFLKMGAGKNKQTIQSSWQQFSKHTGEDCYDVVTSSVSPPTGNQQNFMGMRRQQKNTRDAIRGCDGCGHDDCPRSQFRDFNKWCHSQTIIPISTDLPEADHQVITLLRMRTEKWRCLVTETGHYFWMHLRSTIVSLPHNSYNQSSPL